jgi:hypothetical protein
MAGPNKGTAVTRRAHAKGYYTNQRIEKITGKKSTKKEKASHDWAAKSRMFYDEKGPDAYTDSLFKHEADNIAKKK